jgi:hypothetical protein
VAIPRWTCEPIAISLGALNPDNPPIQLDVAVHPTIGGLLIPLKSTKCFSPGLTATIISNGQDGHPAQVHLRFDPAAESGLIDSRVDLFIDGEDQPVASIPVMGEVYRQISFQPSSLFINLADADHVAIGHLKFTAHNDFQLRMSHVAIEGIAGAKISEEVQPNGNSPDLEYEFQASLSKFGLTSGTIQFEFDVLHGSTTTRRTLIVPVVIYKPSSRN